VSGDAAAQELLKRYLRQGARVQPPDGWSAVRRA
jgi:hypothetical protein